MIGFQAQMQAISSVLLRRRQNSVIVVGEAGVGKTACATGFVDALAQCSDSVAGVLHGTPVWSLDVSALRAGRRCTRGCRGTPASNPEGDRTGGDDPVHG